MATLQVVAALSNDESLCIGEITQTEAECAMECDPSFNGTGVYLMSVSKIDPKAPATVLAKFCSEDAALILARFFRLHGHLEAA